jgi:phosphoglycolate phosphatase
MVGDRAEDILAANANDIKAVGVSYGYGTIKELKKAILVANSTLDLMQVLF